MVKDTCLLAVSEESSSPRNPGLGSPHRAALEQTRLTHKHTSKQSNNAANEGVGMIGMERGSYHENFGTRITGFGATVDKI